MMKMAKYVAPVITAACALFATSVVASITGTSSAPDANIAGTVTNEVFWDGGGTTDWTSGGILVELSSGSVYNELAGGSDQDAGNPGFWGFVPTLEFETWVGPAGDANVAGGCGDCGGGATANFDGPLNVSWFNTSPGDTGVVKIASVALSNDAWGVWTIVSAGVAYSGHVQDGAMFIPEPTSLMLLGLGGLAVLRRR